ncbi:MAG TPA: DUF3348 domain-containing protein [Burkholderiaceae bacterium]|nr:DUF3348 domain-containing protein [Burkholderiaceae bacterium]
MHSNFSSSRLVRLLQETARVDAPAPRQDFAERLGLWVGAFDAMTLHAAHQSIKTLDAAQANASAKAGPAAAVDGQLHQVRAILAQAITAKNSAGAHGKRPQHLRAQPAPAPKAEPKVEADYAPYRQRHAELQRNMELMIGPLREHVRQALSQASPPLRQLAALDAVWEQLLAVREQRLLATVPKLMEKRFKQLRQAHRQDENPLAWEDAFGQEWQQVALAELGVRLEPVVGLVKAFSNQVESIQ